MAITKRRRTLRRIESDLTTAAYHSLVNVRNLIGYAEAALTPVRADGYYLVGVASQDGIRSEQAQQAIDNAKALLVTHIAEMQKMVEDLS